MKKIVLLATSALMLAGSLHARGGHGSYYYDGWNGWIAPFFIGSMLGYSVARQPVIYTTSPAVIYTNAPVGMVQESYTVQESEGPVYEERWVYFEDCKCERKVLINIQQ
jgi:hypothetical protein